MRKLKFCHVLIAPFLRKLACVMLMHTWLTFSSEIVSEIIKRFRYYALHGVLTTNSIISLESCFTMHKCNRIEIQFREQIVRLFCCT